MGKSFTLYTVGWELGVLVITFFTSIARKRLGYEMSDDDDGRRIKRKVLLRR